VKSSVESLTPTRVRLTVEVPFEELTPSVQSAYKRISTQVAIPGFRRGKVPAALIDQRVGRTAVLEEAVNQHLPQAYGAAVDEHKVKVVGQPEVDVTGFSDGEPLTFTAEVDIRPDIVLPDLSTVSVTVDDVEPTDELVDEQLDALRARFASLTVVERPAATGDFVTVDLLATHDGAPVDEASVTGISYEVGAADLVPGLDEALSGLSAGESATFTAPLRSGEHAGHDADYAVTVTAVRERSLPEADDDFAQLASEFDTLEELRADIRTRLARVRVLQQQSQARDRVLDALIERVEVPLPQSLVSAQMDEHFGDGHGDEEHRAEYESVLRKTLTAQFLLDAVAAEEKVVVNQEELTNFLIQTAPRYGLTPDQFAQELVDSGQVPAAVGEVARAKALTAVVLRATVTDESGRPVAILTGDEPESDDEDVEPTDDEAMELSGGVAEDAGPSDADEHDAPVSE